VQKFKHSKSGTNDFAISFVIVGEYLKLKLDVDIGLLDNKERFLSTNAMEFFKVWFTHGQLLGEFMYITHPHLWDIMKNRIKEKGESEDSVIKFVRKKFSAPIEVNVVLVPLQDANHWSVIIMSDDSLYHYDLLKFVNIFHSLVLHCFFDKIWAMKQGKLLRTNEWKQVVSKMS